MTSQTTSARLCAACGKTELKGYPPDVSVCRACDLPRHRTLRYADEIDEAGDQPLYVDPDTGAVTDLTPAFFIERSGWVFAKTMPENPHEYTVRDLANADARKSTCLSHDTFEWFVRYIREHGQRRKWGRRMLSYLEVDGWKYWTMGWPPEVTTIINREKVQPPPDLSHLTNLF